MPLSYREVNEYIHVLLMKCIFCQRHNNYVGGLVALGGSLAVCVCCVYVLCVSYVDTHCGVHIAPTLYDVIRNKTGYG